MGYILKSPMDVVFCSPGKRLWPVHHVIPFNLSRTGSLYITIPFHLHGRPIAIEDFCHSCEALQKKAPGDARPVATPVRSGVGGWAGPDEDTLPGTPAPFLQYILNISCCAPNGMFIFKMLGSTLRTFSLLWNPLSLTRTIYYRVTH